MSKITAKSHSIKRDERGKLKEINFQLQARDYLLFTLDRVNNALQNPELDIDNGIEIDRKYIKDTIKLFEEHLKEITIKKKSRGNKVEFGITLMNVEPDKVEETKNKINKALENELVSEVIREFLIPKKEEKLHKQPRNYLKTMSKIIGKDTNNPTLFSMPEALPTYNTDGNIIRDKISKNTAILGSLLFELWDKQGKKEEIILDNLSELSNIMGVNNFEVKIYLLYLGGYNYPLIDKTESGLSLSVKQLFEVEFKYSKETQSKYEAGEYTEIGGGLIRFIKDEPIKQIIIRPNKIFLRALEGEGIGNVLVKNGDFIKLGLSLSELGFKLLSYTASNKPSQTINEDSLIRDLGLDKALKTQGRPRVRATILKAFKELKDNGHVKEFEFNDQKEMYSYKYSGKYVEHSIERKNKAIE